MVDLDTNKVVSRWPLPDAHNAHAIFLDEGDHRVFVATRQPPRFVVLDADTGQVISSLPFVGVNSDMSFDVVRKRIYVKGSEAVSVFQQNDANRYEHISDVATAYRAKSSIFVQDMNRLYVAASGKGKPDAKLQLRVYEAR